MQLVMSSKIIALMFALPLICALIGQGQIYLDTSTPNTDEASIALAHIHNLDAEKKHLELELMKKELEEYSRSWWKKLGGGLE